MTVEHHHPEGTRCFLARIIYYEPDRSYAIGTVPCCGTALTTAGVPNRPRCMTHGKAFTEWDAVMRSSVDSGETDA